MLILYHVFKNYHYYESNNMYLNHNLDLKTIYLSIKSDKILLTTEG